MLKLTRRVGETMWIGKSIAMKVFGVKGNQVRLGIEVSRGVSILREEIAGGAERH